MLQKMGFMVVVLFVLLMMLINGCVFTGGRVDPTTLPFEVRKQAVAVAVPEGEEIIFDGQLLEPIWQDAPVAPGSFWSRIDKKKFPFNTEVRIVYTTERLIVGIIAYDDGIIYRAERVEDGYGIFQYDCLALAFNNNWFVFEPTGGKVSYIASGSGSDPDIELGTYVKDGEYWSAEWGIKFNSLDFTVSGLSEIDFGVDRRKQKPKFLWADWNYIGLECNPDYAGTLKVDIPKRPLDLQTKLDVVASYNFGDKNSEVTQTVEAFLKSHSIRGGFVISPYDKDKPVNVPSVSYSHLARKFMEARPWILENHQVFAPDVPGEFRMWGYQSVHTPITIQNPELGANMVYRRGDLTVGMLDAYVENEDGQETDIILRPVYRLSRKMTIGGHFLTRYAAPLEEDQNGTLNNVAILDFSRAGAGYRYTQEAAFSHADIQSGRFEGQLKLSMTHFNPIISWSWKGVDHINPDAYDPTPLPIYGIFPMVESSIDWEQGKSPVKGIRSLVWLDRFRFTETDELFYKCAGWELHVDGWDIEIGGDKPKTEQEDKTTPQKPKRPFKIGHGGYMGVEESVFVHIENGQHDPSNDTIMYGRYSQTLPAGNEWSLYGRIGEVKGADILTTRLYLKLSGSMIPLDAFKKLMIDGNFEWESHNEERRQQVISGNFLEENHYGVSVRYVRRKIAGELEINNGYLNAWYKFGWGGVSLRYGFPNSNAFVNDLGIRASGKTPLSDWFRWGWRKVFGKEKKSQKS